MAKPATYINIDGEIRDASNFPAQDRYFRNAWAFGDGVIDIDMPKAREIQKAKIRAERAGRFEEYDTALTKLSAKNLGNGALNASEKAEVNAAEAARQKLRDAPNDARIDAASTPSELKALTLDVLIA